MELDEEYFENIFKKKRVVEDEEYVDEFYEEELGTADGETDEYGNEDIQEAEDFQPTFDQIKNSSKKGGGFIQGLGKYQYSSRSINENFLDRVEKELKEKGVDDSIIQRVIVYIENLQQYTTMNPEYLGLAVFYLLTNPKTKLTSKSFHSTLKKLNVSLNDAVSITIILRYIRHFDK